MIVSDKGSPSSWTGWNLRRAGSRADRNSGQQAGLHKVPRPFVFIYRRAKALSRRRPLW
jgi:hypothetical protein